MWLSRAAMKIIWGATALSLAMERNQPCSDPAALCVWMMGCGVIPPQYAEVYWIIKEKFSIFIIDFNAC